MDGFDLGSIVAHIKADTTQFTAGLEDAKAQADGFSSHLNNIAIAAAAIVDAVVIGFGVKSVKAFSDAQAITAQLNQVLTTTGKNSQLSVEQVHNLAMSLEEYSGQTHTAIEAGQTILLQFSGITAKTLPEASKAMVDLAQRMGVDTVTAAKTLGIALDNPDQGLTRLKRDGIDFTTAQVDAIKAMQKSGDTAGAAALMMQVLETKVGGAGAAYRNTLAGGVAELKAKLEDFEEGVGGKLVQWLTDSFKFYQEHAKVLNIIAETLGTVIGVVAAALVVYGNWLLLTKGITLATKLMNAVFIENPIMGVLLAITIIAALILEHWSAVKQWFQDFVKLLSQWFGGITSDIEQWWTDAGAIVEGVWQAVQAAVQAVVDWFEGIMDDITGFVRDHIKAITDWAIVIGTILAPTIVSLGVQAVVAISKIIAQFVLMSAQAVVSFAKMSASAVVSAAQTSFVWVTQTLPKIIAGTAVLAVQGAINIAKMAGAFILQAAETAASWAITFAEFAAGMAVMVVQFLIQAARMAVGWLLAMGPIGLIVAVVAGIVALIIANFDTVKKWFDDFVSWFKDHWGLMLSFIIGPLGLAIQWIVDNWSTVKQFFSDIWNDIKNVFKDAGTFLYDVGKDIIQGLINGVENMADQVKQKVQDVANGIKDVAKKILGVFSPSTVFHEIGMNVGQGLINGMNTMQNGIANASASMAATAVSPASAVVNNNPVSSSQSVSTTIHGGVNIGSNVDAQRFLRKLTYNQELAKKGGTPVQ